MSDSPDLLSIRDAEVEILREEVMRLRDEIRILRAVLEEKRDAVITHRLYKLQTAK